MTTTLSPYARLILDCIGAGFRLRIPFDGGPPSLVQIQFSGEDGWTTGPTIGPLEDDATREMLNSGLLTQLTEHRYGQRAGWRERKLDGDKAAFYCCMQ